MRKMFIILVLAAFVTGGAFSQLDISVGGGVFFLNDFGRSGAEISLPGYYWSITNEQSSIGLFYFLDMVYMKASVEFFIGNYTEMDIETGYQDYIYKYNMTGLNVGILGKYPIVISNTMTVFPAFGIDYQMIMSLKYNDISYSADNKNALWIKIGGGLDYSINKKLFIRGMVLYGIRITNEEEENNYLLFNYWYAGSGASVKRFLGQGIQLKVAVGYKL